MSCFFKKFNDGWSPHKNKILLTSGVSVFVIWIFCLLKMEPISCPETVVTNYYSMPADIPQQCRSHSMIWQCGPWFDSAWSSSHESDLVLHIWIEDYLTYLSAMFKGGKRKHVLHLSKYSMISSEAPASTLHIV
jgi:hypothetical protein